MYLNINEDKAELIQNLIEAVTAEGCDEYLTALKDLDISWTVLD